MQLLQSSWSEVLETTVKNCFRKAGISEEVAEEAINKQDDPFKDLSTDELEDSINEFRERFPEEVHTELNATILLDIDAEFTVRPPHPPPPPFLSGGGGGGGGHSPKWEEGGGGGRNSLL